MVDKKISELPEVTSVGSGDVVPVVVDDNGLITSKVSVNNFLNSVIDNDTIVESNNKLKLPYNPLINYDNLITSSTIFFGSPTTILDITGSGVVHKLIILGQSGADVEVTIDGVQYDFTHLRVRYDSSTSAEIDYNDLPTPFKFNSSLNILVTTTSTMDKLSARVIYEVN